MKGLIGLLPVDLMIILEEFFQTSVGQGMVEQSFDSRERTGGYIGTGIQTLDDMGCVANGGGQHLRGVVVGAIDLYDVSNQADAIFADVIQSAHEGRNVSGTSLGC